MHGSRSHYHVRDIGKPPESVGRVSKDDIKLFVTDLQPVAHVEAVNPCMFRAEVPEGSADEFAAAPVSFHHIDIIGSPGGKLEADCSGSSEEVEQGDC